MSRHAHAGMSLAIRAASSTSAGAAVAKKLKVGDSIRSARRRFTAEDVAAYAAVTGDRNPVHLDDAFARTWFTRGRVVHGALVASLLPRLIASRFVRAPFFDLSSSGIPPNTLPDALRVVVGAAWGRVLEPVAGVLGARVRRRRGRRGGAGAQHQHRRREAHVL